MCKHSATRMLCLHVVSRDHTSFVCLARCCLTVIKGYAKVHADLREMLLFSFYELVTVFDTLFVQGAVCIRNTASGIES
ncbi:hypothetical protein DUNSADRAFT_3011 [Dunaliella salina]|uniref:Secreted protein n=1 Tax=Dunaliella salina TaxID=3046 RepID=A0ABQ7GUU5_DUNSA|nr:hypothetical protein DUNSADRAFT_3011 [Dunaliella salina]|eukprot:KAF5838340.1 hypothetical protein DUNSADRAFT_3011 [Dunaliella salina]